MNENLESRFEKIECPHCREISTYKIELNKWSGGYFSLSGSAMAMLYIPGMLLSIAILLFLNWKSLLLSVAGLLLFFGLTRVFSYLARLVKRLIGSLTARTEAIRSFTCIFECPKCSKQFQSRLAFLISDAKEYNKVNIKRISSYV